MKLSKINKHFFPEKEHVTQSFIYLYGDINHESTAPIIQEIIAANLEDDQDTDPEDKEVKEDVINLLICSPGGEIPPAMTLISVIEASEIPVRTIFMGECGSAALIIGMSAPQRVITPYSSILSHQFWSGLDGSYSNIEATMKEFNNYHEKLVRFYIEKTGLDRKKISKYLLKDTDTWLRPEEAVKFNLADIVSDLK